MGLKWAELVSYWLRCDIEIAIAIAACVRSVFECFDFPNFIRVAPRLYGCHGLSKLCDPISSSIIPPLFLPPELR